MLEHPHTWVFQHGLPAHVTGSDIYQAGYIFCPDYTTSVLSAVQERSHFGGSKYC